MKYRVHLTRTVIEHRIVIVETVEGRPDAARQRALCLARGEVDAQENEDDGAWCDGEYGRAVVRSVKSQDGG